ncbi:MAG: ComF family protein [Planctomycetes bacterium]|nr:ComF family protein [Planctomycetota bacterium]
MRFGEDLCPNCKKHPPPFAAAFSAVRYAGASRELILKYKFQRDEWAKPVLLDWLQMAADALQFDFDVVVPVPSHFERERRRGFSPVREIAAEFAELRRTCFRDKWIARIRNDPPQGAHATMSRVRNVRGAFAPTGRKSLFHPRLPGGRRVLLIDDVFTSGSTAAECARALRRSGAASVAVATIARGGLPGPYNDQLASDSNSFESSFVGRNDTRAFSDH